MSINSIKSMFSNLFGFFKPSVFTEKVKLSIRNKSFYVTIVRQNKSNNVPAILWIPGGEGSADSVVSLAKNIVSNNNLAIFIYDHSTLGGTGSEMAGGDESKEEIWGAYTVLNYMWKEPYVNTSKVIILGTSHGAWITLLASSNSFSTSGIGGLNGKKLAGIVEVSSPTDIRLLCNYWVDHPELNKGVTAASCSAITDQTYKEMSPIFCVKDINAPALIVHSKGDPIIPIQHADLLVKQFLVDSKPFDKIIENNKTHGYNTLVAEQSKIMKWIKSKIQ